METETTPEEGGKKDKIVIGTNFKHLKNMLGGPLFLFVAALVVFGASALYMKDWAMQILLMSASAIAILLFGMMSLVLAYGILAPTTLEIEGDTCTLAMHSFKVKMRREDVKKVRVEGEGDSESCAITLKDPAGVLPGAEFVKSGFVRSMARLPVLWVSRLSQKDLPNPMAENEEQLLELMEANHELFRFHLGVPANLMEQDAQSMVKALKLWKETGRAGGTG